MLGLGRPDSIQVARKGKKAGQLLSLSPPCTKVAEHAYYYSCTYHSGCMCGNTTQPHIRPIRAFSRGKSVRNAYGKYSGFTTRKREETVVLGSVPLT